MTDDWLKSIAVNREPVCSALNAEGFTTGFKGDLPPYVSVPRNPSFTWELGKAAWLGERYESFKCGDPSQAGWKVTIVSSDKDLMQLVGPTVSMYDPMKDRQIGVPEVIDQQGGHVAADAEADQDALDGNVGGGSALKIERGKNAQWSKGGLQYGMPVR